MSREPEQRGRCRLALAISVVHFSVRPIAPEEDQMRQAILFRWPLVADGAPDALRTPHHGGRTANTAMLYE